MRRVILESPYAGASNAEIARNVRYARAALRDSLQRGEAPIASHLLYTQPGVLDDAVPAERQQGIDAGLAWRTVAEASVVYTDLGISRGMEYGIAAAEAAGVPVEYRTVPDWRHDADTGELAERVVARLRERYGHDDHSERVVHIFAEEIAQEAGVDEREVLGVVIKAKHMLRAARRQQEEREAAVALR